VDPEQPSAAERDEIVRSKTRSERSPRDMALSLLVLLVPIALFLGFYRVVLQGDAPIPIDPASAVAQARAANAFPVSDPPRPEGWTVTSATFQQPEGGRVLRVGYVTPDGTGMQLVQGNVPAERLLRGELGERPVPTGTVDLGGRGWQSYDARPGERALVLLEPARTVVVVGGDDAELRELAGALR